MIEWDQITLIQDTLLIVGLECVTVQGAVGLSAIAGAVIMSVKLCMKSDEA